MNEKFKSLAGKIKGAVTATAVLVGDLNGDGKVDHEDAKIATEWAKKNTSAAGNEAIRIGKEAMQSDMVKDAAAGAAVGAAIAIPVPVIGPLAGAAIGAGLGVYKNIIKKDSGTHQAKEIPVASKNVHAELLKFDELRQKSIITDAEFENQKSKLLSGA